MSFSPQSSDSPQAAKSILRREMRRLLAGISEDIVAEESNRAWGKLQSKLVWQQAARVMLYMPIKGEVNILPLMEAGLASGKVICLPRFEEGSRCYRPARVRAPATELRPGPFGVMEPPAAAEAVPLNQLDLVLVPGLAFDRCGQRLGRGQGMFDRMLASVRGTKCGVAFDQQLTSSLPVEPHDVPMSVILTPTHWLTFDQCAV